MTLGRFYTRKLITFPVRCPFILFKYFTPQEHFLDNYSWSYALFLVQYYKIEN
jgi:hypothetical protein